MAILFHWYAKRRFKYLTFPWKPLPIATVTRLYRMSAPPSLFAGSADAFPGSGVPPLHYSNPGFHMPYSTPCYHTPYPFPTGYRAPNSFGYSSATVSQSTTRRQLQAPPLQPPTHFTHINHGYHHVEPEFRNKPDDYVSSFFLINFATVVATEQFGFFITCLRFLTEIISEFAYWNIR